MIYDMQRSELIALAQRRLLERFGTATQQRDPQPGELIERVVTDAASSRPIADDTDIRAAMTLVAAARQDGEAREAKLITLARRRGMPWREIASHLGFDSSQAAQQRHKRLTSSPDTLIYAFRVADEKDAPWHGDADALSAREYETGTIHFNPAERVPFSGRMLEVRYGPVDLECMPTHMRAYALINNRRIAPTAAVQQELFGA
jgi:hypothetical protein